MSDTTAVSEASPMCLVRGSVKVEWVDLGEGLCGDYNPDDPNDMSLLRFDVYLNIDGDWVPVDDASYCTQIPSNVTESVKRRGLEVLMKEIAPVLGAVQSIKKVCERLSWISPSWLGGSGRLHAPDT